MNGGDRRFFRFPHNDRKPTSKELKAIREEEDYEDARDNSERIDLFYRVRAIKYYKSVLDHLNRVKLALGEMMTNSFGKEFAEDAKKTGVSLADHHKILSDILSDASEAASNFENSGSGDGYLRFVECNDAEIDPESIPSIAEIIESTVDFASLFLKETIPEEFVIPDSIVFDDEGNMRHITLSAFSIVTKSEPGRNPLSRESLNKKQYRQAIIKAEVFYSSGKYYLEIDGDKRLIAVYYHEDKVFVIVNETFPSAPNEVLVAARELLESNRRNLTQKASKLAAKPNPALKMIISVISEIQERLSLIQSTDQQVFTSDEEVVYGVGLDVMMDRVNKFISSKLKHLGQDFEVVIDRSHFTESGKVQSMYTQIIPSVEVLAQDNGDGKEQEPFVLNVYTNKESKYYIVTDNGYYEWDDDQDNFVEIDPNEFGDSEGDILI